MRAVWAEKDVASLAAALMAQRPPHGLARMRCSRPSVCTTGSASSTLKRISPPKLRAMEFSAGCWSAATIAVSKTGCSA